MLWHKGKHRQMLAVVRGSAHHCERDKARDSGRIGGRDEP